MGDIKMDIEFIVSKMDLPPQARLVGKLHSEDIDERFDPTMNSRESVRKDTLKYLTDGLLTQAEQKIKEGEFQKGKKLYFLGQYRIDEGYATMSGSFKVEVYQV